MKKIISTSRKLLSKSGYCFLKYNLRYVRHTLSVPALIVVLMFSTFFVSCYNLNRPVIQAYDLRMEGKIEQAEAFLESLLQFSTGNTIAIF